MTTTVCRTPPYSRNMTSAFFPIPDPPPDFKSGFVAIVGRPNVGKSTLVNSLVGHKIAITSPTAQTTRRMLRGILTTSTAQIVFLDTPGIHKPQHLLGQVLVKNALTALGLVDSVLFVADGSGVVGRGDLYIADLLAKVAVPVVMGLNKADLQPTACAELDRGYQELAARHHWSLVKFSALTGAGLLPLQEQLLTFLEPGPYYYPPDCHTDQPEVLILAELIREQILHHTRAEIPHAVAVVIDQLEETPKITRILATIYVERPSQRAILLGKGGLMLKSIGTTARQEIQKLICGPVYLELFVKVQPHWRQSPGQLAELGYRVES